MNDKNILMYILSCFIEYDTAELKHSIFFQVKIQKTKTVFKSKIFPYVFFLKWEKNAAYLIGVAEHVREIK